MDELLVELKENQFNLANVEEKISKAISTLQQQQKELSAKNEEIKAKIKNVMEEKGITGYDNEYLSITYVAPFTKKTVDSSKLKSKYPNVYEQCLKTNEVSSSIRIKIKENKENE